jgi:hypothetical protein
MSVYTVALKLVGIVGCAETTAAVRNASAAII